MARIAERSGSRTSRPPPLAHPTRASLLTGRNATTNGMATIAEFASGFPGIYSHPLRERVHLRGAGRARLQHLLPRQVAPDPGRGVQPGRVQGSLAAGSGLRALLRLPRRGDQLLVPGPGPRQPPDRAPGRPEDGYHLADDLSDKAISFIRDAKVIDPDKPFFMYFVA